MLRSRSLPIHGKKADLLNRLEVAEQKDLKLKYNLKSCKIILQRVDIHQLKYQNSSTTKFTQHENDSSGAMNHNDRMTRSKTKEVLKRIDIQQLKYQNSSGTKITSEPVNSNGRKKTFKNRRQRNKTRSCE